MTEASANDGGGGRRVGQVVVVVGCALALVLAGAIAPSLGSPFEDGPAVNASDYANGDVARALQNGSDGSVPENASRSAAEGAASAASDASSVVGSPKNARVGGQEPLANFSRQSSEIQFVVQAPSNSYYRVGAYQSFDGYGWSRENGERAFSGAVPGATPPGDRFTARVTLNASAYAVPVPWKPTSVEGPTPLAVRETGGIVPRESLSANQSFTVTAVEPTRDPDVLSQSGYDYPTEIERTYLEVSENVSDRVVDLAGAVTADATNPYEEAVAIEAWLEANKNYSLNATTDPSRPVTEQFLFELDAGYCQYFASSMAVMLRSQGVPARYVVGYAPGTRIGEETYAVTGSKAHAWVEAYFEGVGWVRFDPTPGASRERADSRVANESQVREAFEASNLSDSVNVSPVESAENGSMGPGSGENGTDGSNGSDGSDGGDSDGDDTDGDDPDGDDRSGGETSTGDSPSSVNVSLNRTAAPGVDVTVTVTRAGEPVTFATVFFNDRYVGTTNYEGEVVGTVPFARNLTVRVEGVNESTRSAGPWTRLTASVPDPPEAVRARAGSRAGSGSVVGPGVAADAVRFYAQPELDGALAVRAGAPDNGSTTRNFSVTADMTFALADAPTLGASVPVRVTIEGRPVADARVRVAGASVGRTNESGWFVLDVPADAARVTVSAARGEVSDSAVIEVDTTAAVDTAGSAVPGAELRVTARYDAEALANATVLVDGARVARTDDAGMATVSVPLDATGDVTVRVERGLVAGETAKPVVTNASFEFEDPLSPGADVVVAVTAAGESVAGASMRVDGRDLGTTDASGLATLSVPANATGNVTVAATLGSLSTTREVDLYEPNASTTPAYLVALPGAPVTVNVTDAGVPVANATVRLVERANGTGVEAGADAGNASVTGANGRAEVTLPVRNGATVAASTMGATATARFDWLFANALAVVGLLAVALVVGVGSAFDRGRVGRLARRARRIAGRVGAAAIGALFAVAERVDAFVAWLPSLPALVSGAVRGLVEKPVRTLREGARRVAAWVRSVVAAVAATLSGFVASEERSVGARGDAGARGDGPAGAGSSAGRSLAAAWRVLVDLAAPSRLPQRTPAEVGRLAIEKGLPEEPVRTLTAAYERAVYGPDGASEADVERARTAAAALESSASTDGSSPPEEAGGDAASSEAGDAASSGGSDAAEGGAGR